MSETDQMNRSTSDWVQISRIDRSNTKRLKRIVAHIGWPTKSKVGMRASHMAWLLVQHADHDVEFQEHSLELMKAAPSGEVTCRDIAYLVDRVRINRGLPQLYGTQFICDDHGPTAPLPIEAHIHLDKRRRAMGLEPFEDYRTHMLDSRAA